MDKKSPILDFKEFCDINEADSFKTATGFSRTDKYFGSDKPGSTVTPQARGHAVPDRYIDKITPYKVKGQVVGSRMSGHGDPIKSAESQDLKEQITKIYLRMGSYAGILTDKQRNALRYTEHKTMLPLELKHTIAAALRAMFGKAGGTLGPKNPQAQSADAFIYSPFVDKITSQLDTKLKGEELETWRNKKIREYQTGTDTEVFKDILGEFVKIALAGENKDNISKLVGPIVDYVWSRIDVGYGNRKEQGSVDMPEVGALKNVAKNILTSDSSKAADMLKLVNPDPEGTQKGLLEFLINNSSSMGSTELAQSTKPEAAYSASSPEAVLVQKKEARAERRDAGRYSGKQLELKNDLKDFVTAKAGQSNTLDIDSTIDELFTKFPEVYDAIQHGGSAAYKYMMPDIKRLLTKAIEAKIQVLGKKGANYLSMYDSVMNSLMLLIYNLAYKPAKATA